MHRKAANSLNGHRTKCLISFSPAHTHQTPCGSIASLSNAHNGTARVAWRVTHLVVLAVL